MKTTIFYTSKYGTTRLIVKEIGELLSTHDQVTLLDVAECNQWSYPGERDNKVERVEKTGDEKHENTMVSDTAERYVLGVPVYAGKPLKSMRKFCDTYASDLEKKPLYLFVCGMERSPEKQQQEIEAAFSERLRNVARHVAFLGGALQWKKMNFVERFLIGRITGQKGDLDLVRHRLIRKFAGVMLGDLPESNATPGSNGRSS